MRGMFLGKGAPSRKLFLRTSFLVSSHHVPTNLLLNRDTYFLTGHYNDKDETECALFLHVWNIVNVELDRYFLNNSSRHLYYIYACKYVCCQHI